MHNHHTLKRVYCQNQLLAGSLIMIDTGKSHHLTNVLRVKVGDQLRPFNDRDGEFLAEISQTSKNQLTLNILKQLRVSASANNISLMFAPIKPDKLHFMIEKATELGIGTLIPILTERSIIREINQSKINQYIIQAAEQSERLTIPALLPLTKLNDAIQSLDTNSEILFCDELEIDNSLNKSLAALDISKNYIILIGPEGGFTEGERQKLRAEKQILPVHIGPQILRAETAALFAISCLQFALGNAAQPPRT